MKNSYVNILVSVLVSMFFVGMNYYNKFDDITENVLGVLLVVFFAVVVFGYFFPKIFEEKQMKSVSPTIIGGKNKKEMNK